jgi:hypothetical protein
MKNVIKNCYLQIRTKLNLIKHIKVALFVGAILNLINQFDPIIGMKIGKINYIQLVITFFVPFAVSVYSAATISKIKEQ